MEAVGRLGTIISQGVSSVAAPFDPFGGAVDIIVVQQEDGTFKSTPWYVRFGKFQGVLKRRQKIVRVAVNGVEANFHMFLDHKGSAYFLEEQESDEEENIFSPPSAASSGDETSAKPVFKNEDPKNLSPSPPANDESTLFRSSEHNTPNSQISDMSTDDSASQNVKNDKSLTRTYSRKRSIFGFFRRRQRTYPDSQSSNRVGIIRSDAIQRVDSLEAAERVANLLDDRWVSGASAKTEIAVEEQDEAFEMSSFSSSNENDTSERNESEAGASLQKNVSDELGLNDLLDKNKVADNGRSILADAAYATEFERPSQGGMDHDGNPSSDGPRTDSMEPEYNDDQLNEPENGKLSQGLRTCDDKSEDRVKTNMIDEKLDKLVSGSVTNSIQMKESNGFEYNVEIKNQDIPQFGILTDSAQASREPFEEVIKSQVQREGTAAYLSHDKSQNDWSAVHHSGSFLVHHNLTSEVTNYEMSYQRDQDERGVISADASEGRCQPKDLMEFAEDNFSKSEALENKMYKIFEPSLDENMHFPLERHNSSDSVQLEAKEIHNLNTDVKDTIENNKCSSLKSGLDCYQCTVLVSVDQIERDMIVAKHENVELEKMTSSMVPHDISTSIQSSNEVDNKLFCNLCKKRIGITQFETTMLQADYNHSQDHGVYETENASPIYKRSCLGHCLRDLTVVPFMEFEEGCNSRDAISGNGFVTTSNCEQDHPKLFDCDNKLKIEAISGDHVCKESVSKIFKGNIINDNGVSENMLASNGMCDSMLARKGVLGNEKEQEFIQVNNICKKHNQSNWLEIQNSDFSQQQQDTCKNPLLNGHLQDEEDFELSGNDETVLDSCLCLSEMQVQSELEIKPVSAKEEVKYKIENEIDHGSEILNTSDQSSDNPDLSAKGSRSSMRIDYLNESCMHEPVSFEMTPLYVPQLCENSKDTITQRSESLLNSGMSSLDANNAFSEPVVSNSLDSGAACLKKQSGHVTMATEIYNMEGKAHKECTPRESASVSMQTCTVTEAAISSMESTSAIEISLCRHLLEEGMGNGAAAEAFDSHKVSLDEFRRFSSEITKDERLVVKICGRYYPWATAAPIILGMAAFGNEEQAPEEGSIPVEQTQKPFNRSISASTASAGGRWRIWRLPFSRSRLPDRGSSSPITLDDKYVNRSESSLESTVDGSLITKNGYYMKAGKHKSRVKIPRSDQLASLNLKEGQNTITFTFSTSVLGQQQVDARVYLWKWNTKIVISDIDGTITKSDVLGQFMPLVGKDWTQLGVAHLFSAIKENGYQFMFLSARAIGQAYITRQFLVNVKQDGKCLPDGPVVMSPDGLVPSLYREVIRRTPHEFKIACLEQIRALFPSDCNPFYAGFGNRDTDEISYLKVGIPTGKIFIINPKGEVAVNRHIDPKSYTLLHTLVHGMFPAKSSFEQEDFNSWNYWRMPLPDVN